VCRVSAADLLGFCSLYLSISCVKAAELSQRLRLSVPGGSYGGKSLTAESCRLLFLDGDDTDMTKYRTELISTVLFLILAGKISV